MALTSIHQLLQQMDVAWRCYDSGVRIEKLDKDSWQRFEAGELPYPKPYLRQAWPTLVFWPRQDKHKQQVQVWKLRLPLDEQGKLDLPSRDRFLQQLLTALGKNAEAAAAGEQLSAVLDGNPFVAQAGEEKQANLNAIIGQQLGKIPSQFYAPCLEFFSAQHDDWQSLGLQGLADLACRWQQHQALLCQAIPDLPEPVLASLCHCLEHQPISRELGQALLARLQRSDDASQQALIFRGLSHCREPECVRAGLSTLLSQASAEQIEVLATLASRAGPYLIEAPFCLVFLEHLASAGNEVFVALMSELMFQPQLRPALMAAMRQPQRSERLSAAIGALFKA
ncbi:MAG: DUF3549 family protein [Cellvibrionaceae bacterium]|nr:DUF3549 family protein [Cellvibrionaceae bacterium]